MRRYAVPTDLAPQWLDTPPSNAERLIRAASLLVEDYTRLAHYPVDFEGYPTKAAHREAFKNATCQQVMEWSNAGIDPDRGVAGQAPKVATQSAGSGSVSYVNVPTTVEISEAMTNLSLQAGIILRTAGLAGASVRYRR